MRILPVLLMVGAVGCMDSITFDASEQEVGSEHCTTIATAVSTGATVAISIDEGFNAWKGSQPQVTLMGSSTTCTGTTSFTQNLSGTWSFGPHNQECSSAFSGSADLALNANHWHNVIHCDQSVSVEGCTGDAPYSAALFVDGPGPNDFSTTVSGALGAVQDPDVYDSCPAAECPIGPCVSACQAACAQGDTDCGQCCECRCKEEGFENGNDACQPQDLCWTGSPGHAVCLPE